VAGARVVELRVSPAASSTFHGRDVFAPAAAALARGEPIDALGSDARDPVIRRTPEPKRLTRGGIEGEVIFVDRFGNAVTNLIGLRGGVIEVGARRFPIRRTYAEADVGAPVAVVGSMGFIELAIRDGDAAHALGLTRGTKVVLRTAVTP
jgi:S-adenosylmethionine hydrolase